MRGFLEREALLYSSAENPRGRAEALRVQSCIYFKEIKSVLIMMCGDK